MTPFVALEAPGSSVWNSLQLDRTRAGAFLIAYNFLNRIDVISSRGVYEGTFTVESLPERAAADSISKEIRDSMPLLAISSYPTKLLIANIDVDERHGRMVIRGGDQVGKNNMLYFLDMSGQYAGEVQLPISGGGNALFVDDEGYIYVDEEFVTLHKFRLVGLDQ